MFRRRVIPYIFFCFALGLGYAGGYMDKIRIPQDKAGLLIEKKDHSGTLVVFPEDTDNIQWLTKEQYSNYQIGRYLGIFK